MLYRVLRALLFLFPAEVAHDLVLRWVAWLGRRRFWRARIRRRMLPDLPELGCQRFGLSFAHPLGLAAGLDKTGQAAAGFFSLGFAFVEAGTFTPRPQPGNPRPRVFRAPADHALVNRMGFNNPGAVAGAKALGAAWRPGPLGVNLGKNKDTPEEEAVADYTAALRSMGTVGDYYVVNVSSPNTTGLRKLQAADRLRPLLSATKQVATGLGRPLLLKISPDLADQELAELCQIAVEAGIAGILATNTTLSRPSQAGIYAEAGGLSGQPLKDLAHRSLGLVHRHTGGRIPVIGVGGLATGADILDRLRQGASLVQAYTGFIYGGPGWVRRVMLELAREMRKAGYRSVDDAVGSAQRLGSK
jgi:dihydroorotate dehydrogenase